MILLVAWFAAGVAAGVLYFGSLWWNTRRFARGEGLVATIALMAARFLLLGGVLLLASVHGAMPLLVMALGVFVARFFVSRKVRAVTA